VISFGFAPLVFHHPGGRRRVLERKFHHIRLPRKSQRKGAKPESANHPHAMPALLVLLMDFFVKIFTLPSRQILLPDLLQVDQSPLSFAEGKMLKRRDRKKILLGIH
jgi:hypothetical protein